MARIFWQTGGQWLNAREDKPLLFSLLEAGLEVDFDCMFGHCRACFAYLSTGAVRYDEVDGLTPEERRAGGILLCSAYPESSRLSLRLNPPPADERHS